MADHTSDIAPEEVTLMATRTCQFLVAVTFDPDTWEIDPVIGIAQTIEYLLRTEREGLVADVFPVSAVPVDPQTGA